MKKNVIILILSLILIYGISLGKGVEIIQKTYTSNTSTTEIPIIVDGIIDDNAWNKVPWGDSFIQRAPYEGKYPSQKTAFKILFDDDYLYVAIKAWDTQLIALLSVFQDAIM